jgi:hypothetical protein
MGTVTGSLTITDNGIMQRVLLSGTGPDFSFGHSPWIFRRGHHGARLTRKLHLKCGW